MVWRALRYLGVPEQDLPDASQEVFTVVHRKLPGFRGDARPETWLYGIALRVASRFRQRARHREELVAELPELPTGPTQERDAGQRAARRLIRRALDTLDPAQREVFILSEIEQLPMTDVARAVGCPLFTAYSRRRIARRRMRRAIAAMSGEGEQP